MRGYAKVYSRFWISGTGKEIRKHGANCLALAFYLMTGPSSNMIGIYYLPIQTICHDTGLSEAAVLTELRFLTEVGFASYDEQEEIIWIPEMAKYQISERLRPNDNQIKGIVKQMALLNRSKFHALFLEKYGKAFNLSNSGYPLHCPEEAPSKPLTRPSVDSLKHLQSQVQNHFQLANQQ